MSKSGLHSATCFAFGPNDELIVGDSTAGNLVAFKIQSKGSLTTDTVKILDLDTKIAKDLGTTRFKIEAMILHPKTKEVILSVDRAGTPVILAVNDKEVYEPHLDKISSFAVPNLVDPAYKSGVGGRSLRHLALAQVTYHEGFLYVSGLSNLEFSSALTKVPYPFPADGSGLVSSSVEIYHAVHDQNETRAPIRAQAIVGTGADSVMIAAYTCTPLVVIPLKDLKDKAQVRGKTVAELGFGNTPSEVLVYKAYNHITHGLSDYVMVVSKQRNPSVLPLAEVLAAPEMKTPEMRQGGLAAIPQHHTQAPLGGIIRVVDYNQGNLLVLWRDLETGELSLRNLMKGPNFFLTPHIAEYETPSFKYTAAQEGTKKFQTSMFNAEGTPISFK